MQNLNLKEEFEQSYHTLSINKYDETVYKKLKEAELEITNTSKRYSFEEVLESMNNIIGLGWVKTFLLNNNFEII